MGDTKGSKPGVLRWGGILASRGRVVQAMVFVAVSVATIAFAFAQLGLVGLGEPNEGMTYAVVQLVPIAIAALLFGPFGGALLGLIAGAALLVHSHVQPSISLRCTSSRQSCPASCCWRRGLSWA